MRNLLLFFSLIMTVALSAQTVEVITDADLQGGMTHHWTNDKIYLLDGFVFLEDGGVLNIEAGTIIKAKNEPSTNDNASALIISRGAQIYAEGTADQPIIFTAELDEIETGTPSLDVSDRGLWGGLIILGKGVIANTTAETRVEGIPEGENRALFGGNDDNDNSGVLRYVSIRHGGAELAPGDEINGLTLGAVGSGTTISHVEVFANSDDGIEFFGGTVSIKFASVAFCGDDSFDWDLGWRGNGQFWFTISAEDEGDNGGEHDGAKPDDGTPFANPTVFNATFIGAGVNGTAKNETALLMRDGTGGTYGNSIFTEYANQALEVEDVASGLDSRQRMEQGELNLLNNIWYSFGSGSELNAGSNGILRASTNAEDPTAQFLIDHLAANGNSLANPNIKSISRTDDNGLDPRPAFGGAAYDNLADLPSDDFFSPANFKGAFGGTIWNKGWTALDFYDVLFEETSTKPICVIRDADLQGGETYNWTNDKIYMLDGFVFLEDGGVLNIQEGTLIKGLNTPSTADNASALIIARGAQIFAVGTKDNPIIFTSEIDDANDSEDLTIDDRGLWGGLIILGKAVIANTTSETRVEGIPEGEPRALFGGNDDNDNSGRLSYVSIRHGGAELAPGDEINGLTLGAVGSGTQMDHIEVLSNSDDGIEFFGGSVSIKYAVVAFCGDDSYDWDLGWRGKGQFWFSLNSDDEGDSAGEHDGAKPDDGTPFANPTIYNATYIGAGVNGTAKNSFALILRDGTGGTYANSIFTEFANHAIEVEDVASGLDSRQRMEQGELNLLNNIWYGFGDGSELNAGANGIINASSNAEDPNAQFLIDHLITNGNEITDPQLKGISRESDKGLYPFPASTAAYQNLADLPVNDTWFDQVDYKGAFGGLPSDNTWVCGWSGLVHYNVIDCAITSVDEENADHVAQTMSISPNPISNMAEVQFELKTEAKVSMNIFNLQGQLIKKLADSQNMDAGVQSISFDASELINGMYVAQIVTGQASSTISFIVNK